MPTAPSLMALLCHGQGPSAQQAQAKPCPVPSWGPRPKDVGLGHE